MALLALTIGSFAIGSSEFVAMGLLPNIAKDLLPDIYQKSHESANATAGWLISVYALGVVVGAPLIAVVAARLPRKRLLMILTAAFVVAVASSAVLPNFSTVLIARFVAGLPHGAFFGVASLVAGSLLGSGKRGRGIALVMFGLTIANVIGVPLITWLGQVFGWRAATLAIAGIFSLTLVAIWLFVPWQVGDSSATFKRELRAFGTGQVWFAIALAAIGFGGLFSVYSYIAPLATEVTRLSTTVVPWLLAVVGLGMTVGNLFGGRLADWSVRRGMLVGFCGLAASLLFLWIVASNPVGLFLGAALTGAWAAAVAPTVQARLMDVADESQSLAASLNHSALNIGNSLGAALGGVVIACGFGYVAPVWVGLALTTLGFIIANMSFRLDRQRIRRGDSVPYATGAININ